MARRRFVGGVGKEICLFVFFFLLHSGAIAISAAKAGDAAVWNVSRPSELFSPCTGECSITFFGGSSVSSDTIDDLIRIGNPVKWDWDDVYYVGGAVSRPVVSFGDRVSIDVEAGMGKRFGDSHEGDFWTAAYLRWKQFPWNSIVKTTVGVSTGLNYATGISASERRDADGGGARLLHYFSPEITFALPEDDRLELVFRLHHRSGVFGLFDGVHGGDHFGVVGLRFTF